MQLIREQITLPTTFGTTPEAEEFRNDLALRAREFLAVTNSTEQNSAVMVARDIRTHIKAVRQAGLDLRRPLTAAKDKIMAVEQDYLGPIEAEQERIERLVTDFQSMEARRVADENRKRAEEIVRLENIRLEAEEVARRAAASITNEADLEAALERERIAIEQAAAAQAKMSEPVPEKFKAGGTATRRVLKVEVLDLHALYRARPELVRLEPNLAAIKATCFPEMPVPGLALRWEMETSIRTW